MLFRQLHGGHDPIGSVAKYYFVKRKTISHGTYLLTKKDNGWSEDQLHHYTNFRLEIIK